MRTSARTGIIIIFLFLLSAFVSSAQQQAGTLLKLLEIAEKNYPLLKAKMLDVQAAQYGVNASKRTLIPSLDASYQVNYATYNNITGMAASQFFVPISGPPVSSNNMNGVFGSVTSLLANWQPVTFGQRSAQVDVSKAGLEYADADARNEIFQHKIKVINAYLDVLTMNEILKVHQNDLKRTAADLQAVRSLVLSGVKPGVDTSLYRAELSKAKVELLNNQKTRDQAVINLSQLIASDSLLSYNDTLFFSRLPVIIPVTDSIEHPLVSLYTSTVDMNVARRKALARTSFPVLGVWSTLYARGSGISYDGAVNSTEGLSFQRYNYGVGLQLSIPLLQYPKIHPQLKQHDYLIQSGREKLNEVELQLRKQQELADTTLKSAFSIVKESYFFLESARFSFSTMQSRYQSGLANFADLIQAQYALIKSETDYKLAYISVWKAFLYKAAVNGDLNLFINQVSNN